MMSALETKVKRHRNHKNRWVAKHDVLHFLNRKQLAVQRKTVLTAAEEMHRLHLTWQDLDEALDTACFNAEALKQRVTEPKEFLAELQKLALEFEDEVGIWLGLKGAVVAVDKDRHAAAVKKHKLGSATENVEDDAAAKLLEPGQEAGVVQVRGVMAKGADKRRITIMPRMLLEGIVQGETAAERRLPKGRLIRTVVVVPGVHCCLDFVYFDEVGKARWNRTWEYEYLGVQTRHVKGEPVGVLMKPWVDLLRKVPELLKHLMIVAQPAAVRDAIVVGWCTQDLANERGAAPTVQQHDLVGSQSTEAIKKLRMHLHMLDALIAGDMTAVCQVTDIICAKTCKDIAHAHSSEMKRWMKRTAACKKQAVKYVVGPLEMAMMCNKIHEGLQTWLNTEDWILKGARQGGHLAYLPDLKAKRLVPMERFLEEWKVNMELPEVPQLPKLGGQKIDPQWLEARFAWLGEDGRAPAAEWGREEDGTDERLKKQITHAMQKLDESSILICADEEEIFEENAELLQDHPAFREAKWSNLLDKLFPEGGDAPGAGKSKKLKKHLETGKAKKRRQNKALHAKAGLHEDYVKKARVCLLESSLSREDLAGQVQLIGKRKKPISSSKVKLKQLKKSAAKKYTAAGKFAKSVKQAQKTKKKAAELKKWLETQPEFAKKSLMGTYVRVCQDQPQL